MAQSQDRANSIRMVTKYEQIEHMIRSKIVSGELKTGERIESEYELAEKLGVHRFTVNKAISNLVRAGLLYREQGKGTFVAAQRHDGTTNCLGVVFGGPTEALFRTGFGTAVIQGIYQAAERSILFFGSNQSSARVGPDISDEELARVDGLLAFEIFNDEYISKLAARRPLVMVDYSSRKLQLPSVIFDNVGGVKRAAQKLIEAGHRRIACVGEDPRKEHTDPAWLDRTRGWEAAMDEAGLESRGLFIPIQSRNGEMGIDAAHRLLKMNDRPTAAIAATDSIAAHMMKVFQGEGMEMPRDMSIVGFGNEEVCEVLTPTLSSIGMDMQDMGVKAVNLLERMLKGEDAASTTEIVKTYLIERESVAPPQ
ncbi:MAG TPA: GntR family transcriptional regulator [Planctomycetes bacterium]|nr:GntR family transcriptional regulator [Planctomycetota bacterium]